jgi:hypothetical protein
LDAFLVVFIVRIGAFVGYIDRIRTHPRLRAAPCVASRRGGFHIGDAFGLDQRALPIGVDRAQGMARSNSTAGRRASVQLCGRPIRGGGWSGWRLYTLSIRVSSHSLTCLFSQTLVATFRVTRILQAMLLIIVERTKTIFPPSLWTIWVGVKVDILVSAAARIPRPQPTFQQ